MQVLSETYEIAAMALPFYQKINLLKSNTTIRFIENRGLVGKPCHESRGQH